MRGGRGVAGGNGACCSRGNDAWQMLVDVSLHNGAQLVVLGIFDANSGTEDIAVRRDYVLWNEDGKLYKWGLGRLVDQQKHEFNSNQFTEWSRLGTTARARAPMWMVFGKRMSTTRSKTTPTRSVAHACTIVTTSRKRGTRATCLPKRRAI